MSEIREITEAEFGVGDSSSHSADLRRISEACDAHDGVSTLNEQACLQLKHRGLRDARLWLADGGFAFLHGDLLDLAVHPDARNRGLGTTLAAAALAQVPGRVEAWSHGDHPAAAQIAARFGLARERELKVMARNTGAPLPHAPIADGTLVRTFRPEDRDTLLEINRVAFAHHPEQGNLSIEDFEERTREPWFDPNGLFVAVSAQDPDHELLGFHWTKVHSDEEPPYGEVYVVAVHPKAAGRGLGKALTNIGLAHLAEAGMERVVLYVDGDNEPAIAVYASQGFNVERTEAQYRGVPARG